MPDKKKLYPSRKGKVADAVVTATTACLKRTKNAPKTLPETTQINMIHVFEPSPPKEQPAVEWILLTNEPMENEDQIRRVVEIYRTRWLIEEYFKAIKTGCAYEKRQQSKTTVVSVWEMYKPITIRDNDSWKTDMGRSVHLIDHLGKQRIETLSLPVIEGYRLKRANEHSYD